MGRPPRFNHVAMSMPADALDETGRKEIAAFYGDVFGWTEIESLTDDRRRFVLQATTYEDFVFLIADDPPMTCQRLDHFGMSVGTLDELFETLAKCKSWAERDSRVDIIDHSIDVYENVSLHNFYVRYLLPMMVEVQHYEWKPGSYGAQQAAERR